MKKPKTAVRRITLRLSEEQHENVMRRIREWQEQSTASRSINDWCLERLLGAENERNGTQTDRASI